MKYEISEKINIERFEEGAIISIEGNESVVCLGKYECEILDILLENEFEDSVSLLASKYQGNTIENDLADFCGKLIDFGILQIKE